MEELIGMRWGYLKEETQEFLLENAIAINGSTCDECKEGKCIIDLTDELSIEGEVVEGEIKINPHNVIYDPRYGISKVKDCIDFKIDEVMTVTEAAEQYNITEGAIRAAIKSKKFVLGVDFRKAGRITLITREAMERVYG